MGTRFALTKNYIEDLAEFEGGLCLEALEESQAFLHQLFLRRSLYREKGYALERLSAKITVLYYAKDGLFALCGIDGYGKALALPSDPPLNAVEKDVMPLLSQEGVYEHNDALLEALESHASFTDWFLRLLDGLSPMEREKIPLRRFGAKGYEKALSIAKKEIAEVISAPIEEKKEEHSSAKPRQIAAKEAPKASKKAPVSAPKDDFKEAERLFKAQEARQRAIIDKLRERLGVHFGWDERFVEGLDADQMLTLIERVYRRSGLRGSGKNWIIVADYEVSEDDFSLLEERYPERLYRADDLKRKPKPETVDLAIVVKAKKKAEEDPYAVRKVHYKGVSAPTAYSVKPAPEKKEEAPSDEEEDIGHSKDEGPYVPPKRWKCPFCPKKNPWHTGEPAAIVQKKDGEHVCLCQKHRKAILS